MHAPRRLLAVSFLAVSWAPAPASAVGPPQAIVATAAGYAVSEIVLVQGGSLTLVNTDVDPEGHDVTSQDIVDGHPLFESATIGPGIADVSGVSALGPGSSYPFVCKVHSYMVGNITVVGVEG
jgi:hypothetical protein